VAEDRIARRYRAREEALEITLDLGVGVLLDDQRRGGVAYVQRQQALVDPAPANPGDDLAGELVETPAPATDRELLELLSNGSASR
jgi:hypothetical protein